MRKQLFATAGLSLGITLSAAGDTWYVDDSVSTSGDGSGWTQAFKTLQEGLAEANAGDEIRVAQGIYKPGTSQGDTFELLEDVDVIGGWAGLGASNPDDYDPALYVTILSGNIGNAGDETDNSYIVVTANDTDIGRQQNRRVELTLVPLTLET